MVGAPFVCPGDEFPKRPAPVLGAHTDEILAAAGYSAARIAALRAEGVV